MLKIKENIEIADLEKVGFEKRYNIYTGKISYLVYKAAEYVIIDLDKRELGFDSDVFLEDVGCEAYGNAIYDLTKAGLLIKEEK